MGITIERVREKELDDKVEEWHTTYKGNKSLYQFLGLSFEDFAAYVKGHIIYSDKVLITCPHCQAEFPMGREEVVRYHNEIVCFNCFVRFAVEDA